MFRLGPRQARHARPISGAASDAAGPPPPALPGSMGDDNRPPPFGVHCARPRGWTGTSPSHPNHARPVTNHGYQDFRLGPRHARYARPISGRARSQTTPGSRLQRVRVPWGMHARFTPFDAHCARPRGWTGRAPATRTAPDRWRITGTRIFGSALARRDTRAGLAPPARPGSMGDECLLHALLMPTVRARGGGRGRALATRTAPLPVTNHGY